MAKSKQVPTSMQAKYDSICELTDAFCDQFLNDEYKSLIQLAVAALCPKRPSPLSKGRVNSWAAGFVHALGTTNFLFDPSQSPHCKSSDIYTYFQIASSTGQGKSKEIRDLLKISYFSADWTLPSRMDDNPMLWMIEINGLIVDARSIPRHLQEIAYQKGLIPYIPGEQ
ncbi:MAG: DUF6398 domain-containing protein [Cyanobacteriota bacterium]|jgi:hypothetical protein